MQLLDWLEHRRVLKKIRQAEQEVEQKYPREPGDDWQHYVEESDNIFEWRQLVLTKYISRKADELHVPLPDRSDKSLWETVEFDNDPSQPKYLTQKGLVEARRLIREEQKAKREAIAFWVPIFFGSAGMITGIIAALKHS
ncbi:hypothetical protein EQV97_14125 [Pseudomonas sp. TMW22090]|uniref:hypothetical protein n=1 Tax=Pseudomonas sp. TMW22090 TaxID=2506434 RepID=UPI001F0EBE96|nr:hypothetical protein [Pseudomonas sp. TMW22090]MCH4878521.1 hypothetical protein [Pseudomonas sp. TMW22090]